MIIIRFYSFSMIVIIYLIFFVSHDLLNSEFIIQFNDFLIYEFIIIFIITDDTPVHAKHEASVVAENPDDQYRNVIIGGIERKIDLKLIEPYRKAFSNGGENFFRKI